MLQAEADSPAAAAGESAQSAMSAVGEAAVVSINIRNNHVNHAISKTRPRIQIPVAVVGKDDDERFGFTGQD